ncbi:hypothetical protein GLOTRDRAFT_69931 [Gloeophyllum trabeum ATCC 11539]|uniref:DnaJ homologue subfamily C member 28 conserved domain-containing protein n=1 Tax=Gloeophyllum trabeum (strain ATCC 11539 / FP-39264 / Madison 617) TaxID=670483 RepID=S7QI62_GLOTA|nr:uncharacterized protein GLOTRDRAFT_69931 [Gloeophyllum trabeum ATCC 11539]EPQ58913.1 hypothetical protein GLOTRDRAFT_69931 [Gloeophyllum trabeum ATCC 11539]
MTLTTAAVRLQRSSRRLLPSFAGPARGFTQSSFRYDEQQQRQQPSSGSASAKLFADAVREEAEEVDALARRARNPLLEKHENWTGEESMQDAVLRMLVDKYKPLRSGPIQTADEKLKRAPPKVSGPDSPGYTASATTVSEVEDGDATIRVTTTTTVTGSTGEPRRQTDSFLPGIEGHKPWHTTFTVPSHATASIKLGNIPPPKKHTPLPLDEKAQRKEREARRKALHATRLTGARESAIDYRLGIKGGTAQGAPGGRPNPISIKGWQGLVEERIERARLEGHFNKISGRGKPLTRQQDEGNPFIAREEFLMNRIVKRQGAAPPWVELQAELESAVTSFREILRQSWTRRAIRTLTISHPAVHLSSLTLSSVTALRDPEWEERERSYHITALDELNALVRKYNGVAPYSVRRPYYRIEEELEKAYRESGEEILRGVDERVKGKGKKPELRGYAEAEDGGGGGVLDGPGEVLRIRDVIREWFAWLRRK